MHRDGEDFDPLKKLSPKDWSKNPELAEYRAKAFAKPEPQADEYYDGFDNPVASAIQLR